MSIYKYRCSKCSNEIELSHSIKECDTIRSCKSCSGILKRIMGSIPTVFNTGGFFTTDYTRAGMKGDSNDGTD